GIEIEQQENDEQRYGQYDLQPLFYPLHRFVLAAPDQLIPSRNAYLLADCIFCVCDIAADVAAADVYVYVTTQTAIFIANHTRSSFQRNTCDLCQRNLCA